MHLFVETWHHSSNIYSSGRAGWAMQLADPTAPEGASPVLRERAASRPASSSGPGSLASSAPLAHHLGLPVSTCKLHCHAAMA